MIPRPPRSPRPPPTQTHTHTNTHAPPTHAYQLTPPHPPARPPQAGRPYELDARTLATLGETDLGGQIGDRLAAHGRCVADPSDPTGKRKRWVTFSTHVRFGETVVKFFEFDEQVGRAGAAGGGTKE
jgi:hypothetical protein